MRTMLAKNNGQNNVFKTTRKKINYFFSLFIHHNFNTFGWWVIFTWPSLVYMTSSKSYTSKGVMNTKLKVNFLQSSFLDIQYSTKFSMVHWPKNIWISSFEIIWSFIVEFHLIFSWFSNQTLYITFSTEKSHMEHRSNQMLHLNKCVPYPNED